MRQQNENTSAEAAGLRTSRAAQDQERNVLALLRGLMPRRPLDNLREAELIAELQANRLLELAGLPEPPVPDELIAGLPRIRVRRDVDLPASGSASWHSGYWLLTLNGSEPYTRQRFSLAHEVKHVLDHPHVQQLDAAGIDREHVADYFAACLLMPKRDVKRLWGQGVQQLSDLSRAFAVSPAAMSRRLRHLGLRPVPRRRRRSPDGPSSATETYYRVDPSGVAA
jgi:IrrE N-terminal-like domain